MRCVVVVEEGGGVVRVHRVAPTRKNKQQIRYIVNTYYICIDLILRLQEKKTPSASLHLNDEYLVFFPSFRDGEGERGKEKKLSLSLPAELARPVINFDYQ